jgi:hypothetical protein
MKKSNLLMFLIILMCLISTVFFIQSCNENNTTKPTLANNNNISKGEFVSITECKNSHIQKNDETLSKVQDCLELDYINDTLNIKHINAAFNCCPDSLHLISVTVKDFVITIDETKAIGKCFCDCLYDIVYQVKDLPKGEYKIKFIENMFYAEQGDVTLECLLNLNKDKHSGICLDRYAYLYNK